MDRDSVTDEQTDADEQPRAFCPCCGDDADADEEQARVMAAALRQPEAIA